MTSNDPEWPFILLKFKFSSKNIRYLLYLLRKLIFRFLTEIYVIDRILRNSFMIGQNGYQQWCFGLCLPRNSASKSRKSVVLSKKKFFFDFSEKWKSSNGHHIFCTHLHNISFFLLDAERFKFYDSYNESPRARPGRVQIIPFCQTYWYSSKVYGFSKIFFRWIWRF